MVTHNCNQSIKLTLVNRYYCDTGIRLTWAGFESGSTRLFCDLDVWLVFLGFFVFLYVDCQTLLNSTTLSLPMPLVILCLNLSWWVGMGCLGVSSSLKNTWSQLYPSVVMMGLPSAVSRSNQISANRSSSPKIPFLAEQNFCDIVCQGLWLLSAIQKMLSSWLQDQVTHPLGDGVAGNSQDNRGK